jgi:general secretion pathway protein J
VRKVLAASRSSGFTLIEVIVALTILSAVLVALAGTLQGMALTSDRVDTRISRGDEIRVVSDFLRRTLGTILRTESSGSRSIDPSRLVFSGQANSLTWVGVMPAGFGSGGRHLFRLSVENEGGKSQLVLRYLPADGLERLPLQWEAVPSKVLVANLQKFALTYLAGPAGVPIWASQWSEPASLPDRVSLQIVDSVGEWPLLIVQAGPPPPTTSGFLEAR